MRGFCRWCGVAIKWLRGIPYEGEIDHRSRCAGLDPMVRQKHATAAHEAAVRQFLRRANRAGNRGFRSR
jgi:hypothetical protein